MFSVSSNILLKFIYLKALVLVNNNNTGLLYQCRKKTAYCLDKNANSLFVFDTWLLQRRKDVKQYLHVFKQPLQFLCSLCCLSNNSKCMSTETGELFSGVFLSKQSVCESHQVNLCNSNGSGHVTKSANLIGWPTLFADINKKKSEHKVVSVKMYSHW